MEPGLLQYRKFRLFGDSKIKAINQSAQSGALSDNRMTQSNAVPEWFPLSPEWKNVEAAHVLSPPQNVSPTRVEIELSIGAVAIEMFAGGLRIRSAKSRSQDYGLLVNQPELSDLDLQVGADEAVITSEDYELRVEFNPFVFTFSDKQQRVIAQSPSDGHFVRQHRVPPMARPESGWLLSLALSSGEPVYGLGEKWSALNKRGQLIRSFNHDALGVNAEISYKNTPFCWSPEGWGLFVHTPSPVTHAVGYAPWSQRNYSCLIEDDYIDVFLLAVELEDKTSARVKLLNPGAELLKQYTHLTGRAPMPPSWSGGVILSKAYYQDEEEVLAAAKEVRKRGLPCDVITLDGRAWQDTRTRFAFEWDTSRIPHPEKLMQELKRLNFKVCVWEYPLVSMDHPWFQEFAEKGWLLTDKRTGMAYEYHWDRQAFDDVLTPLPNSGIVDFTHPDAYAFWRDAHKSLFDLGVDMIKADFGEQVEDDNMLAHNGESGMALHNVYSHLYNRCVYEAAERYCQSGPFLFSRSAWTGSQRYNSQWGGDPQADWEGMMSNIRGGLSWGMSGAPFYATDIGGFYKDTRNDALYVRWAQAGVFSAHFRLHGIGDREPWSYSKEAETAATQAIELRYQLQHYLRNAMQTATETGMPVQRPMVLAFPHDKQSWAFENQFMFGDEILVAPCFKESGEVEVFLPEGVWARVDARLRPYMETFQGGRVYHLTLELDEIAAFIRQGSKIPLNALTETTAELTTDADGNFRVERFWPNE